MGVKITELTTTTVNDEDYIPVANSTDGTRKVLMEDVLAAANPTIDTTLDTTSTNAVTNAAVATAIATNTASITENASDIATNTTNIATNTSDISELGEDVDELKSDLEDKVDLDGESQVTPQNLQIVDYTMSPNLCDEDAITSGTYITAAGTENSNSSYFVTDYIPVTAGSSYVFTRTYQNARGTAEMRFVACYDSDKAIMSSSGSSSLVSQPYTVPDGVSYIRISSYANSSYSEFQFEEGTEGTEYYAYGTLVSAVINDAYLPDEDVDMSDIPAFELVDGQNLYNTADENYASGYYINRAGTLNSNANYVTTGFIPVEEGDVLVGSYLTSSGSTAYATFVYVCAYDSSKTAVVNSGVVSGTSALYYVPSDIAYVRISIRVSSHTEYLQIERGSTNLFRPYVAYEDPHYELKESYMYDIPSAPEHVYLPSDIYVAVGRTIELYNEQVVLDCDKYHFQWVCGYGNAYKRKFSITGETVGDTNLDLYLYDDKENLCWCGRCVLHVVAASNPTVNILPIGDSLTNWKAWLPETMLLSSNSITWVGTRYSGLSYDSEENSYASGTIHHEGRSGWKAADYLADTAYSFDTRYDGVSTVDGTANPFWDSDNSTFSLSYYLTTQTGVSTPDAVQIFLGTNDVREGVDTAVANIASMVETIHTEYPTMPIFICNAIYRSNQNGYGSVGDDAYSSSTGASSWQYNQDALIMDLAQGLYDEFKSDSLVTFVPLISCMDREYDFGQVSTQVNPRCSVTVDMPAESVHPQACGYYQMADVIYSTICGVLS